MNNKIARTLFKCLKSILLAVFFLKKTKKHTISFYSDPDISDSSLELFLYLNNKLDHSWSYFWVVNDVNKSRAILASINLKNKNIFFLKKKSIVTWIKTRFFEYQFDTHGAPYDKPLFGALTTVCLWHGSPLKLIGNYINPNSFYGGVDYFLSAHKIFNEAFRYGLNCYNSKVIQTGYPRNDVLKLSTVNSDTKKNIIWMPTYAKSVGSMFSGDGYKGVDSNLDESSLGFVKINDLHIINSLLNEYY